MTAAPIAVRIANAERVALETLADVLSPPPPIDLAAFAAEHVVFPAGEPFPGPYDRERWWLWEEPLAAMSPDDPCREVAIRKSAQLGGTILSLVVIYAMIHYGLNPGGVVHPTDANGDSWSRGKFDRYLPPVVRDALCASGKEGGNTVRYKERRDGRATMEIAGANSPATLSQRTWFWQVQDDLSKWSTNPAGDPEAQADSRSKAVEFAKIVKISTPMLKGDCRISDAYDGGTQEELYLPCPHCGGLQTLKWEVMRDHLDPEHPEQAHFVCLETRDDTGAMVRGCGGIIERHHLSRMMRPGSGARWIARYPERAVHRRSFAVWTAYSWLTSWEAIARDWLCKKGKPTAEQTFWNDTLGLAYDGDSDAPLAEKLIERAKSGPRRGLVPAGFPLLFLGIDTQDGWLAWHLIAYGRDWRRHVVEWGTVPYPITDERAVRRLSDLMASTWPQETGGRLGIDAAAIDGNYETAAVLAWVRRHPASRLMAVRGVSGWKPEILKLVSETSEKGKKRKYGKRFYNVAVDMLKLTAYRSLKIEAGAGDLPPFFVTFASGLEDAYFDELTSNRRVEKIIGGRRTLVWELARGRRDEALDTWNYAEAAARRWGYASLDDVAFERLIAERCQPIGPAQLDFEALAQAPRPSPPPTPSAPPQPQRRARQISGGL